MKKLYYSLCFLLLAACGVKNTTEQAVVVTPLPSLPTGNNDSVQGISAPFAGILGNQLIAIGGCNFPEIPAAQGGKKVYYNDIYTLDVTAPNAWKHAGAYPQTVAYGATVPYKDKLICVGGNNEQQAFSSVLVLGMENGKITIDSLPSMPVTMDNHSATIHRNVLYAGGGNIDGKPQNRVFRLNLDTKDAWEEITSFPAYPRIQPQLIATGAGIKLLGGFYSSPESGAVLSPFVLDYSVKHQTWDTLTILPASDLDSSALAMVGGFSVSESPTSFIIGGGVNRTRFLQALNNDLLLNVAKQNQNQTVVDSILIAKHEYMLHQPDWYQFNTQLFRFDTQTCNWKELANVPQLARAGAGVALVGGNTLYIIGGELKPGIRTDQVNKLQW